MTVFGAANRAQLHLGAEGNEAVAIWAGAGLAVYWLAVLSLGAVGAAALGRAATPIVSVALVAAIVAVGPLLVQLTLAQTPVRAGTSQMPALVQAAGEIDPGVRTLVITAEGPHAARVQNVVGTGTRLDDDDDDDEDDDEDDLDDDDDDDGDGDDDDDGDDGSGSLLRLDR